MILIVDDDFAFAQTIAKSCRKTAGLDSEEEIVIMGDALAAIQMLAEEPVWPRLMFVNALLPGPNGFAFLNEVCTSPEACETGLILMHDTRFLGRFSVADLADYRLAAIVDKSRVTPAEIQRLVTELVVAPAGAERREGDE